MVFPLFVGGGITKCSNIKILVGLIFHTLPSFHLYNKEVHLIKPFIVHLPSFQDRPPGYIINSSSFPGIPPGYYRQYRRHYHIHHYYLYLSVLCSTIHNTIRDPMHQIIKPWTWRWSRHTPVSLYHNIMEKKIVSSPSTPCYPWSVQTSGTWMVHYHQRETCFAIYNPIKQELNQKPELDQIKPHLLHKYWIIFDMQYGLSLDEFMSHLNLLKLIQAIKALHLNYMLGGSGINQALL